MPRCWRLRRPDPVDLHLHLHSLYISPGYRDGCLRLPKPSPSLGRFLLDATSVNQREPSCHLHTSQRSCNSIVQVGCTISADPIKDRHAAPCVSRLQRCFNNSLCSILPVPFLNTQLFRSLNNHGSSRDQLLLRRKHPLHPAECSRVRSLYHKGTCQSIAWCPRPTTREIHSIMGVVQKPAGTA